MSGYANIRMHFQCANMDVFAGIITSVRNKIATFPEGSTWVTTYRECNLEENPIYFGMLFKIPVADETEGSAEYAGIEAMTSFWQDCTEVVNEYNYTEE